MKEKDEFRGKWKVVEYANHIIVESGLSHDEAVREARRLSRLYPGVNGEPSRQYDVEPMRRRKS